MKKLSAILLTVIMIFGLAACGGNGESGGNVTTSPTKSTSTTKPDAGKTTQNNSESQNKDSRNMQNKIAEICKINLAKAHKQ